MTLFDNSHDVPLSEVSCPVFTLDEADHQTPKASKLVKESKAGKKSKVPGAPRPKKIKLDAHVAPFFETSTGVPSSQDMAPFQDDDFEDLLAMANKELASSAALPGTCCAPLTSTSEVVSPTDSASGHTPNKTLECALSPGPDRVEPFTPSRTGAEFNMDMLDELTSNTPGSDTMPIPMAPTILPTSLIADHDAFDLDELEALALGEASRSGGVADAGSGEDEDEDGSGEARGTLAPPRELTLHEKLAAAALGCEEPHAFDALVAESRTPRRGGLLLALAERAAARAAHEPEAAGKALRRACDAMGPWHSKLAERMALHSSERAERPPAYPTMVLLDRESRIHPDPAHLIASVKGKAQGRRTLAP